MAGHDLVEKVARDWNISEQMARGIIRNVLDGIAEPSDAMMDAGEMALLESGPSANLSFTASGDAGIAYRAMIAALRREVG
jgi:hypothetical protein